MGLDIDLDKIPPHLLQEEDPIFAFAKAIIDATHKYSVAYKPNLAFFESYGVQGLNAFKKVINFINKVTKDKNEFDEVKAKMCVKNCDFTKLKNLENQEGFEESITKKNSKEKQITFANGANRGGVLGTEIVLPENYSPNDQEEFMNDNQLEFFRQKLLNWKSELLEEAMDTKDNLSSEGLQRPDISDRAQVETNASIQLRTRDRERKLISKIDSALRRIDLKTYGYCEETGEPIGLKRLMARPVATLSIEAQEKHERDEKIFIED